MAKHGKKYQDAAKLIEEGKAYAPAEAMELVKKTATAKFDETIELHVRLGVDPKYADQQVRGAVVLPNGTGKTNKEHAEMAAKVFIQKNGKACSAVTLIQPDYGIIKDLTDKITDAANGVLNV